MIEPKKELLEAHLKNIVGERVPFENKKHLSDVIRYLQNCLSELGYEIEIHPFQAQGKSFENIIARIKGKTSGERIIVGAHFDAVPGSPGADDNASGVAVLLELARIFSAYEWNHTVEFIGFNLEEWNMLGSAAYVRKLKREGARVRGMISIEMVGFKSDAPNSQKMPPGFGWFYPKIGDFIGIVGNVRSWKFLNFVKTEMKKVHALPVESLVMPFNGIPLPPTRWSDHSPFWDAGYPAVMITDTSFYRNPHYHSPTDTIETLDLEFMKKVTEGIARTLSLMDEV